MEVKNNVACLREKAGLTVYELSKRCGFVSGSRVLSNYVTRAEQGNSVKVDTALSIYSELKKTGVCENFEDVFYLDHPENQKASE